MLYLINYIKIKLNKIYIFFANKLQKRYTKQD